MILLAHMILDNDALPLNPFGRTGLTGRGLLGRWGPNLALDAVVTRWKRFADSSIEMKRGNSGQKQVLEFLAVKRKDVEEWSVIGVRSTKLIFQQCYRFIGVSALS